MKITPQHMIGFVAQLQKEAAGLGKVVEFLGRHKVPTSLAAVRGGLTGHYGRQMLVGAGLGAGVGALADKDNRLRGISRGALGGALLTGVGQLGTKGGRDAAKDTISNFGKRTRYQFTGKGLGANDVEGASRIGVLGSSPSAADITAHQQGWTNIPGIAKGLAHRPGQLIRNSWHRMDSPLAKSLTALSAVDAVREAGTKSEPGGPGRAERALGSAAGSLGYMLAPAGILPAMALGTGMSYLGKNLGRFADRAVSTTPAPAPIVPAPQAQPTTGVV